MQLGETRHFTFEHTVNIPPHPQAQPSILDQAQRLLRWLEVARLARLRKQAQAAEQPAITGNRVEQDLAMSRPGERRMSCSDLQVADVARLKLMHSEQAWPYDFPDLDDAEFVVKRAVHDEDGNVVGAVIARKTVELYFLGDPQWRTPRWRLEALKLLHEGVRLELRKLGYSDGHCWIPPQVEKSFGRRLVNTFGWAASRWKCYSRRTN